MVRLEKRRRRWKQLPEVGKQTRGKGIAPIEAIARSLRLLFARFTQSNKEKKKKKKNQGLKCCPFFDWHALIQRILFNITIYLFVHQRNSFRSALPLTLCCLRINTLWTTRCLKGLHYYFVQYSAMIFLPFFLVFFFFSKFFIIKLPDERNRVSCIFFVCLNESDSRWCADINVLKETESLGGVIDYCSSVHGNWGETRPCREPHRGITTGEIIDNLINIRVIVRHRAPIINAQLDASIDTTRAICNTCRSINNTRARCYRYLANSSKSRFASPSQLHRGNTYVSANCPVIVSRLIYNPR